MKDLARDLTQLEEDIGKEEDYGTRMDLQADYDARYERLRQLEEDGEEAI